MATQKRFIAKNGLDNNSQTITNVSDPSGLQDAATKNYVSSNFVGASSSAYPTVSPSLNLDFVGTRQLDSRITFARNSIATYYDGQTTALAEQNLVTYSQTFANAYWAKQQVTATDNATTSPDGATTATTIVEDTSNLPHGLTFTTGLSISIGTYTASAYFKYNTRQWVTLSLWDGITYNGVLIDLVGGTIVSTLGTIISSTITSVGSGWYRVSITKSFSSAISTFLGTFLSDSATPTLILNRATYTGNGTSGIYIWGAQLEQRSSATAYTPTTTAAITNYIPQLMTAPAGVARFDCDPITRNNLGLLIEESRTNLLTYSAFNNLTSYTQFQTTTTTLQNIAPDGTLNASSVVPTVVNSQHYTYFNFSGTLTSGVAYTYSLYVKAKGYNYCGIFLDGTAFPSAGRQATFNLVTGVVDGIQSGVTASMVSVGNSWYRCSITATCTTSAVSGAFGIAVNNSSSSTGAILSYVGDGFSGISAWGAQLEAGSFSTSYIPTVASTVTRAADAASMTGTNFSSWYNQSQGSFYCEGDFNQTNPTNNSMFMEGGSSNGDNTIGSISAANSSNMRFTVRNTTLNTTGDRSIPYTFVVNASIKTAILYNGLSGLTCALNGVAYTGNAAVPVASIPDRIFIGSRQVNQLFANGHIRKLSYYPVALSASNLVALTS